jgi:signal transduction histidine kinase/CheY-like chemotaxis protein
MRILWGPELGPQLADIFRHTLESGERYISPRFTEQRADLGEEKSYDWEAQRLTLPNGKCGVVCYFSDTTEQYAQETALREAKEAAEAANASKDRFLAVLSHELRTPLTPVLMVAGALEHDPDLRPDVREDIVMIKRNVELETKLIDDLLDLSRITSGKAGLKSESVDLNETVRQVCGICQPQLIENQVQLKLEFGKDVCLIPGDPARLQQVLWNVLKNAIKFTPAQGIVRVSTERLSPDRCEVRVEDKGIGIPPDILPRIFNAFEQGEAHITRQFGGLGLGLAISRALVELHGGAIRAESAGQGQGATFVIELPGQAGPIAAETPSGNAADARDAKRIRLLLVEDHADTARALARFLRAAGLAVVTAGDVASALAAAEREPFDLIVSDLGLPDGDGYEIMRAIRARRVVPGIAMSGYGMDEDIRRSREAGFTEHLVKPLDVPQLIDAIHRVTETRQ